MDDKEYLAALERVDSLKAGRDAAIKRAQVAEDERDALAASLEKIFYNAVTIKPGTSEAEELQGIYDEAGTALSSVSASLARRDAHPDDLAVDRFAEAMKEKLSKAREKGRNGWQDENLCSAEFLADLLVGHVSKGNAGNFEDIANLAMMLHHRGEAPSLLTTSLARLKAQWCEDHAERFMDLADNARDNGYMAQADAVEDMAQELRDEAAELRRQAEDDQ